MFFLNNFYRTVGSRGELSGASRWSREGWHLCHSLMEIWEGGGIYNNAMVIWKTLVSSKMYIISPSPLLLHSLIVSIATSRRCMHPMVLSARVCSPSSSFPPCLITLVARWCRQDVVMASRLLPLATTEDWRCDPLLVDDDRAGVVAEESLLDEQVNLENDMLWYWLPVNDVKG